MKADLTKGRGWFYVLCAGAGALALAGYADFDFATGDFDLKPFNVKDLATDIAQTIANGLAALAVWRKWGRK